MKVIYESRGKKYTNEQDIIDDGVEVIYCYCNYVRGRWQDIEHLMVEDNYYGFAYAQDVLGADIDVIDGRYEPELEAIYLNSHPSDSQYVRWYIDNLITNNV